MQLHRDAINPQVNNRPPPFPPAETESDLSGPGETSSVERGDDVKIDLDNGIPAEQQRGEKYSQLEEGDVEMKIAELPIKENVMENPDRCWADRMETKASEDPPTLEIHNPPENIVDMKENNEPIAMKRLQDETEKDNVGGKWLRREGIKRNLRELPRTSYEECENDCDELDQSKKYKSGINYILAALHRDVTKPLEEADQQPISEPAVPDGTVPGIQILSAAPGQTGALVMGRDGAARLHSNNRYSAEQTSGAEQTNESAVKGTGDIIQGGENKYGAECSVQSRRNQRRGNNHPGYIWKTLIFVLWLLGSALGGVQTGRLITPDPDQWYHNKPWRTHVRLNPEM